MATQQQPPEASTINVLLTSFPGLGLPSTLCIPLSSTSTVADLGTVLYSRLASSLHNQRLILTTASNRAISPTSTQPLASLLANSRTSTAPTLVTSNNATTISTTSTTSNPQPHLLTLRLSTPLCGGKGGFGSQLRAAGGRMSSRKKNRANADAAQGSARGPDGRRLRTVAEAKALAEYLAVKPEMEKKEKEERRRKWEAVVEASERKREEMVEGRAKGVRGDAAWLEGKEEAEAKVREAVERAVREGLLLGAGDAAVGRGQGLGKGVVGGRVVGEGAEHAEEEDDDDMSSAEAEEDNAGEGPSGSSAATTPEEAPQRKVFGWDDDDGDDDE